MRSRRASQLIRVRMTSPPHVRKRRQADRADYQGAREAGGGGKAHVSASQREQYQREAEQCQHGDGLRPWSPVDHKLDTGQCTRSVPCPIHGMPTSRAVMPEGCNASFRAGSPDAQLVLGAIHGVAKRYVHVRHRASGCRSSSFPVWKEGDI